MTFTLKCAKGHKRDASPEEAETLNGTACPTCGRPMLVYGVRARV